MLKLIKSLECPLMEYSYKWYEPKNDDYSIETRSIALKKYLNEFDFTIEQSHYSFHWSHYMDNNAIIELWTDLSYESKLIAFHLSLMLAEADENQAMSSAGASW